MQNIIQIPQKMKTGVQDVFKWEKCTLPFRPFSRYFRSVKIEFSPISRQEDCWISNGVSGKALGKCVAHFHLIK